MMSKVASRSSQPFFFIFCALIFLRYAGIEKGPATFGVIKRLRDNDMELHTDRQVLWN